MNGAEWFWGISIALAIVFVIGVVSWLIEREPGIDDSSDADEFERRLLTACAGDRDLVERLIQHERNRLPHLARWDAVQTALERLWADRRD